MRVPLAEVGRRGRMDIAFALQNGETILCNSYCEVPFKITRMLKSRQRSAHLILMHCTAGLFGGDEIECAIRVKSGARVLVTQQSATKIHPSGNRPAAQKTTVVVESGAQLQLYFEPVIPFASSILRQETCIDLAPGAQLVFWEGFMAGRIGHGESWQFRELSCETRLCVNKRVTYLERFRLLPELARTQWTMGDHVYVGTGLYVGPSARSLASDLHNVMPEAGIDSPEDNLAIVRATALHGPNFYRCRESFAQAGQTLIGSF
jgi:urease accessory protein UreH